MTMANLTGPDRGPQSYDDSYSYWKKKIFSSSSNNMLVEFRSDSIREGIGFSATIHYSQLPSKECETGLDMTKKSIQSPNYPNSYDNNISCKWLISVHHDMHITLKFTIFNVIHFKNCSDFFDIYFLDIVLIFLA